MGRPVKAPPPAPEDWEIDDVDRVIDGDTCDLTVRRPIGELDGFRIEAAGVIRVRIVHLDTPEKGNLAAAQATADLSDWLHGWGVTPLRVTTQGKDAFGRYLGDVYVAADRTQTASDHMVRERGWPVWTG
jgi:endonuclease YncB( thermonuclease family)